MSKKIVTLPDSVLRKKAQSVKKSDFGTKDLAQIIHTMSEALRGTSDGIGIAAPQIGISKRIFIASEEALAIDKAGLDRLKDKENETLSEKQKKSWKYFVFINPEIVKISNKKLDGSEGCLSVPGKYGRVLRAEKIRIRAYDEQGKIFERGATKLFARLFQHEIDHLNGILFIDKASELVDLKKKNVS